MFVLTHRPPDPPDPDVTYLKIQLSWGSAVSGPNSQIFAATVKP